LSNQEIARQLVIEVGTVKNHVHNVLKKLDLNSRRDLMARNSVKNHAS
jgi:DNA-binding NarL/FixJ family response regulator